jgi:hypothetical protein
MEAQVIKAEGGNSPSKLALAARCGHDPAVMLPSYAKRPHKADTSSDKLRNCARCTTCGTKGATWQQPGWTGEQIGFAPWPARKVDQALDA